MNKDLEEKARLVTGRGFWHTYAMGNLPAIHLSDGPHGLRKQNEKESHNNKSFVATCFPTASCSACSFDEELLGEMARAIATEAKAEAVSVVLGPGTNMKRSPLCGRNFEYFSEDPYLAGKLTTAYINAMQAEGVGCSVKHFAANNQETRRQVMNSIVSERTLREYYLSAFEMAVKESKPATIMASYNQINGAYACENKTLLTDILRKDWGYEGCVISDWGACVNLADSLRAGMDLEMPDSLGGHQQELIKQMKEAEENKDTELLNGLKRAVRNVENLVNSYPVTEAKDRPAYELVGGQKHHELARKISGESAVLLKNNGILPLKAKKVLVIGAMAKNIRYQGGGSSHITIGRNMDIVKCLLEAGMEVSYEAGYELKGSKNNSSLSVKALESAKDAEIVIFIGGLTEEIEGEGFDRANMRMPENQRRLIEEIVKINRNVVYVSFSGAPYEIPCEEELAAIVQMYLGGQAVDEACADILTGKVNPCGRLAETWPISIEDTPCYGEFATPNNQVEYKEKMLVGYRYYTTKNKKVRYPFGYGLSYTSFQYEELKLLSKDETKGKYRVSVTITNTGTVSGKEVVEIYVKNNTPDLLRPVKVLAAFAKVELKPGEKKTLELDLSQRAFMLWCQEKHEFAVIPGSYEIIFGRHAFDEEKILNVDIAGEMPLITDEVLEYETSEAQRKRMLESENVYSMRSSLRELSKWGGMARFLFKIAPTLLHLMYRGVDKDDPEVRMALEMVLDGSIDSVSCQSGGIIKYDRAVKMVTRANAKEKRNGKIK